MNVTAPVATRPAATVILVRRHRGELQVHLLKRSLKSVYMAGFYVFPGGVLDPQDRQGFRRRLDCDPQALAERFGNELPPAELTAFAVAAIRETFEEAGVLLAARRPDTGDDLPPLHARRMADGLPSGWLNQLAAERGWKLRLSALFPWSHWITPEGMKYRFEARFFLAGLPPGQDCRPDGREVIDGVWMTPEDALAANMAGEIPLSPPNLVTLQQMLPFRSVDTLRQEALRRGWGEAMMPRMIFLEGGTVILEPWDPQYREKEICLDPGALEKSFLPAGRPFSRLFFCKGRWRPVATG